jgi:hypothetical protein
MASTPCSVAANRAAKAADPRAPGAPDLNGGAAEKPASPSDR